MFEDFKTGFIKSKIIKLMDYIMELRDYNIHINYFIPELKTKVSMFNIVYILKINNIIYKFYFNGDNHIKIYVNSILIYEFYTYDYGFSEEIWYHTLPKSMMNEIRNDSKIIQQYINNIKNYMKTTNSIKEEQFNQEQEQLNKIFK